MEPWKPSKEKISISEFNFDIEIAEIPTKSARNWIKKACWSLENRVNNILSEKNFRKYCVDQR